MTAGQPSQSPLPFPSSHYDELRRRHLYRLLLTYVGPLVILAIYFVLQHGAILAEGRRLHLQAIAENQANTFDLFLSERHVRAAAVHVLVGRDPEG